MFFFFNSSRLVVLLYIYIYIYIHTMFLHIDNLNFFFFPGVIGGAIIYLKEDSELGLNEIMFFKVLMYCTTGLKADAQVYWHSFSFTSSYNTETTHQVTSMAPWESKFFFESHIISNTIINIIFLCKFKTCGICWMYCYKKEYPT